MQDRVLSLPLVVDAKPAPTWQEWTLAGMPGTLDTAMASPEPERPQGEYNVAAAAGLPEISLDLAPSDKSVELLAPAGGPDAAFAALHYGADAIYLGLKKFSARAEAENFTIEELAEVTAYAHSLQPRRRVFVTINTLIRQDEIEELVEAVAAAADIGVDALIIQDLGVFHLVRNYFPDMELHASTQLAVHNRAGAETLRHLGFKRVVLARELTFEEVHDITATAGIETEVFIHGALCYSYSGLCLYSSQTLGRSGNRGKCAYSCRDSHEVIGAPATLRDGNPVKRDPSRGFPFSMKDLALPEFLPSLRAAGVSCFKIEGRKKSPLYVATTTDYYRRLLDGNLAEDEQAEREAELQSVFSRPWTRLFLHSHRDKEVADRDTVGHRGTPIGKVESIRDSGTARARLRFRTSRAIERHDGLQIDLPVLGKPFGFAVDRLSLIDGKKRTQSRTVFSAPAQAWVEVALPEDHPDIPPGATVYCSSSQEVKRKYRHDRPKRRIFRPRRQLRIEAILDQEALYVVGRVLPRHGREAVIEARRTLAGSFAPARDPAVMEQAFRGAFVKLGDTSFALEACALANPNGLFVPVSLVNQLRRELIVDLETALNGSQSSLVDEVRAQVSCKPRCEVARPARFAWSIKVDRIGFLDVFESADWSDVDEIIVDIARDHPTVLCERLEDLADSVGRDRIRLALPPLTRKWEEAGILHKIERLLSLGWMRWEAANLSAWSMLECPSQPGLDIAADWTTYTLNRLAARQLLDMGVSRFALSPEDGIGNMRLLLAEFGERAVVIVYQDTPLFLAESCAYANLIGGCPGKANCRFESMDMISSHGERVTAIDYHCRTIVLNQGPFCLSTRLGDVGAAGAQRLRTDFVYRKYVPEEVRNTWRLVRSGRPVLNGHAANFDRGVL